MQVPNSSGLAMSKSRTSRIVAVAATCACAAAVGTATWKGRGGINFNLNKRIQLPRPLVDAISGAVGEFGQILMLYPVETIKVRCQTDGISAAQVVAQLGKQAAQPGGASLVLKQLYSGIGATAVFSIAVGAVHWLSFCAAKRAALDMLAEPKEKGSSRTTSGEGTSTSSSAAAAAAAASEHHHHHVHVSSSHHMHEEDIYTEHGADAAAASSNSKQLQLSTSKAQGNSKAAESTTASSRSSIEEEEAIANSNFSKQMSANVIAAALGALATALVESPVELFRHQAQAGLISGNLVREMGASVKRNGPGALWFGFLPFLLEAFPYDMSELGTYSQLRDMHSEAIKPNGRFNGLVSKLPSHAWDAAIGACAGAAAVLLSMPGDTIKTYLQTHTAGRLATSPASQVALFFATGRSMVQQRGLSALYLGVVPRLLQQVPSSTICWYSVEACQKALAPYTVGDPASGGHGGH